MRFIEYMHLDNSDPEAYRRRFVPGKETRARIEAVYGPLEPVPHDPTSPARVFKIPGAQGTVGFINPVTEPFCTHCSRLRLTSDKKLRPCLLTDLEMDIAWAFAAPSPWKPWWTPSSSPRTASPPSATPFPPCASGSCWGSADSEEGCEKHQEGPEEPGRA